MCFLLTMPNRGILLAAVSSPTQEGTERSDFVQLASDDMLNTQRRRLWDFRARRAFGPPAGANIDYYYGWSEPTADFPESLGKWPFGH